MVHIRTGFSLRTPRETFTVRRRSAACTAQERYLNYLLSRAGNGGLPCSTHSRAERTARVRWEASCLMRRGTLMRQCRAAELTVSGRGLNLAHRCGAREKRGGRRFWTALPAAATARFLLAMWCSMRRAIFLERHQSAERPISDALPRKVAARFMNCPRRAAAYGTSG